MISLILLPFFSAQGMLHIFILGLFASGGPQRFEGLWWIITIEPLASYVLLISRNRYIMSSQAHSQTSAKPGHLRTRAGSATASVAIRGY